MAAGVKDSCYLLGPMATLLLTAYVAGNLVLHVKLMYLAYKGWKKPMVIIGAIQRHRIESSYEVSDYIVLGSVTNLGMVRLVTIGMVKLSGTALLSAFGQPPKLFCIWDGGSGGERLRRLKFAAPMGRRSLHRSARACNSVVATHPHLLQ